MPHSKIPAEIQKRPFWSLSMTECVKDLHTDARQGISEEEAVERLAVFGPNVIERPRIAPWFFILLNQFKSPLILILIFAGIVTCVIGHYRDAVFIFASVAVNAVLGFYQEFKAERALAELKTYLKQRARVIRGGVEYEIDAAHLVPGDLIRLAQGDRVPADGRFVFVNDFQVDEAILTGESLPAAKSIEPVSANAGLGDQFSMAFAGTLVTQGIGTLVVCRTDFSTEIGKIAALVASAGKEETPLQKSIKTFSLQSGLALGVLTLIVFAVGVALGYSRVDMFLTSVAIAVSAVPEGLPVAMTVILAIGVQRMARRKGVIRKLVAAETLGSTTVILTDKTGTLTMAKMELNHVLPTGNDTEESLLALALLNTNVLIENRRDQPAAWRMSGRVLEVALVRAAAFRGIVAEDRKKDLSVLNSLPFNSANKFSAAAIHDHGKNTVVFFGAPDIFIEHSTLNSAERKSALETMDAAARSGERVVGVATQDIGAKKDFAFSKDLKLSDLSFKGFITFRDPVRPSVKHAIHRVERAGIKTMIMTGDHRGTAEAVAEEVGMHIGKGSVLDAAELRALSDKELKKRLPIVRVISRVTPLDKMRVVRMLQEMGEVVAMTGDGVNDAPSLKQADIGIAMGSGTEVARDVADLVLLDDDFETISAAVEEGRQIRNNIRKVLVYLLSDVVDGLFLIGGSLAFGLPLPLNALQILWVNFFSDSFPAVAFAFEKDIDGLSTHPQDRGVGLFDPLMKFLIMFIGLFTSAFIFAVYWVLLRVGVSVEIARTFTFVSFGLHTLFVAFSVRSLEKGIFQYPFFSNRYLVAGISVGVVLMGIAVYVPFFQSLFGTISLSPIWLLGVVLIGLVNITAIELGKWAFRRKDLYYTKPL